MEAILIQPKDKSEFDFLATMLKKLKVKTKTIILDDETDTTTYLISNSINKAMLDKSIVQDKKGEYISIKHNNL
jgi:hypothetical protein